MEIYISQPTFAKLHVCDWMPPDTHKAKWLLFPTLDEQGKWVFFLSNGWIELWSIYAAYINVTCAMRKLIQEAYMLYEVQFKISSACEYMWVVELTFEVHHELSLPVDRFLFIPLEFLLFLAHQRRGVAHTWSSFTFRPHTSIWITTFRSSSACCSWTLHRATSRAELTDRKEPPKQ